MKQNRAIVLACAALAAAAALMLGVYTMTRPAAAAGEKQITVEVVHRDAHTNTFSYETTREYLGALLLEEGLIAGEDGPYGLYIVTVDGEDAVYEVDQSYWAFYQNGEYAAQGIDLTPLADGDQFALVYTFG